MPIGAAADFDREKYVPVSEILAGTGAFFCGTDGVSKIYSTARGDKIGLISPVSDSFCQNCNKIRLTSDGKIKPCLHSKDEINIRGLKGEALESVLKSIIYNKPKKHNHTDKSDAIRNMNSIGG